MLALIYAALGEKTRRIRAAARAGELLPIAKDSFDGPILTTTLAAVSAKLGEKDFGYSTTRIGRRSSKWADAGNSTSGTGVGFFARRSAF